MWEKKIDKISPSQHLKKSKNKVQNYKTCYKVHFKNQQNQPSIVLMPLMTACQHREAEAILQV